MLYTPIPFKVPSAPSDFYPQSCRMCGLHKVAATYRVRSEGQENLDVLVVGDHPDGSADREGRPFVGASGNLLRSVLGLLPSHVRIGYAYACKCRPFDKEKPKVSQMKACRPFLDEDLRFFNPKIVVPLGATSFHAVTGKTVKISSVAGRCIEEGGRFILPTFHPSADVQGYMDLSMPYHALIQDIQDLLEFGEVRREFVDARVVTADNIQQVLQELADAPLWSIDVETNCRDSKNSETGRKDRATIFMPGRRILCVGITTDEDKPSWVFPPSFVSLIRPLLKGRTLLGHNIGYDLVALAWLLGWTEVLDNDIKDTFIHRVSFDMGARGKNGLEDVALVLVRGTRPWKWMAREFLHGHPDSTYEDIPFPTLALYNGYDTKKTLQIYNRIESAPPVYEAFLLPLVKFVSRMTLRGLPINTDYLQTIQKELKDVIGRLETTLIRDPKYRQYIRKYCKPIEFTSTNDMAKFAEEFYEKDFRQSNLPVARSDKTGAITIDKTALAMFASVFPFWGRVKAIRQYHGYMSKFLVPFTDHVSERDGCVHTTFNTARMKSDSSDGGDVGNAGAKTGRLSSSSPALQNTIKANVVRRIFEAPPGYVWIEFDFSGAEVRVQAHLAKCELLTRWFNERKDPYIEMSRMLGWADADGVVSDDVRREAKTEFLAKMFDESMTAFAKRSKTDLETVRSFYRFFAREFHEIIDYQRALLQDASNGDYIETDFGRRSSFHFNESDDDFDTINALFNLPVQSLSSDILCWQAMRVEREIPDSEFSIRLLIHDSIVGLCRTDLTGRVIPQIKAIMEDRSALPQWKGFDSSNGPLDFCVPLEASVKVGPTLGDMKKVLDFG